MRLRLIRGLFCGVFVAALLAFASPGLNAQATDEEGFVLSHNWLVLGPFLTTNGCETNRDVFLENHIAPSHIACEYPAEGDDIEYDPIDAASAGYVPDFEDPVWRVFDDSGFGVRDFNLDADVNGPQSDVMAWLVTYVEYTGDAPVLVEICTGSDDDNQVWVNETHIATNLWCAPPQTCGFNQAAMFQPGINRIALGIWDEGGEWLASIALSRNGQPITEDTEDFVFLGIEGGEPRPDCEGPEVEDLLAQQKVEALSCTSQADGSVDVAWTNPPENDDTVEIQVIHGDLVKTVPGDATSVTFSPDEIDDEAPSFCVVNYSGVPVCCGVIKTTATGHIKTGAWLALGPFAQSFGCYNADNHIAPSFIGCEYPALDEETRSGYNPDQAVSDGLHPSAPDGVDPIWYAWDDGSDDATQNFEGSPAGGLDNHMMYLATYVEYLGDARDITLCIGSDDGAQVWFNGVLAAERTTCQGHNLNCQSSVLYTMPGPGLYCLRFGVWDNGGGWVGSLALQDDFGAPIVDGQDPDWIFHGRNRPEGYEDMVPGGTDCPSCTASVTDVTCEFGTVGFGEGLIVSWTNPDPDDCVCTSSTEILIDGESVATVPADRTTADIPQGVLPDTSLFTVSVVNCSGDSGTCSVFTGEEVYINCGGEEFVDGEDRVWSEDSPANPSPFLTSPPTNTAGGQSLPDLSFDENIQDNLFPGEIFQIERWSNGPVEYTIPIDSGNAYDVHLLFREHCCSDGCLDGDPGADVCEYVSEDESPPALDPQTVSSTCRIFNIHLNDEILRENWSKSLWAACIAGTAPGAPSYHIGVSVLAEAVEPVDGAIKILIEDLGGGNPPENASIKGIAIIPSEGGPPSGASLKPGDVNGDAGFNISDPVAHLNFLFASGPLPACYVVPNSDPVELSTAGLQVLDFNGDGSGNIADAVGALNRLFGGGGAHVLGEGCADIEGDCTDNCTE